jgi:hypothetical protein
VEVDFKDVIKIADFRSGPLEKRLGQRITEEAGTSGSLGHAKKVGEAGVLVLPGLVEINHGTAGPRGANHRNSEGGEEDERSSALDIRLGSGRVVGLAALTSGEEKSGLAKEAIVPRPSGGMEKIVLANEEDTGKLLVIVGHHDVLGGSLAKAEEGVDVLNAAEGLLPELELNGNVELLEPGLEVALESVGVAQVDGMHLGRVLGGGLDVIPQQLAKPPELSLPGILKTEIEGLQSGALIKKLEAGIVSQNIQNSAVGLPKELQPGGDNGSVGSVTRLLAGDGG